ncbi:MAG TPA: hypothetical protein VFB79_15605, partial [Candidatus Angelobacter sp.]|nr:hypothetical protein [Candidatus Angelobacter sp.]
DEKSCVSKPGNFDSVQVHVSICPFFTSWILNDCWWSSSMDALQSYRKMNFFCNVRKLIQNLLRMLSDKKKLACSIAE